jgi:hypothetical protein
MEFLLVIFRSERDVTEREVLIDGVFAGLTDHLITLAPGTYTISLDGARDFRPPEIEVVVDGTSPLAPMTVLFV